MRSSIVLDLRQRSPEVAGACDQLADLLELDLVCGRPFRSSHAFSAEAEHAERVRLPHPEQRRRHRQIPWMRAKIIGCEKVSLPARRVGSSGGSPLAMRAALAHEHVAELLVVEAGGAGRA